MEQARRVLELLFFIYFGLWSIHALIETFYSCDQSLPAPSSRAGQAHILLDMLICRLMIFPSADEQSIYCQQFTQHAHMLRPFAYAGISTSKAAALVPAEKVSSTWSDQDRSRSPGVLGPLLDIAGCITQSLMFSKIGSASFIFFIEMSLI